MNVTETKRVVVVSPSFRAEGGGFRLACDVDAQALRRYLLYWDEVAYAYPNGLGKPNFDSLGDLHYLHESGVLTLWDTDVSTEEIGMSEVPNPGNLGGATALITWGPPADDNPSGMLVLGAPPTVWPHLSTYAQVKVASTASMSQGGVWTIGQCSREFAVPSVPSAPEYLVEATLIASLPVPVAPTPLPEIIKFRQSRRAELLQLRAAIERLRTTVVDNSDSSRALEVAKEELEFAVTTLARLQNESGMRSAFSTLKLYLGVSDGGLVASLLAAFAATGAGLPLELGVALGLGINTLLTFASRRMESSRGLPESLGDFAYVYDVLEHFPRAERI